MEDKKTEKAYKIKIIDTYTDKDTGLLAKNFGKILEVPKDISEERAKDMIKKHIAKEVKENGRQLETKTSEKSGNKT